MSVFTVLSEAHQPALIARIEQQFPGKFFHWSNTTSFIRASGTAKAVADQLGIRTRNAEGVAVGDITGVAVVQASPSYWGWTSEALWEWLKSSFEATD